jgi:hypothetical protein
MGFSKYSNVTLNFIYIYMEILDQYDNYQLINKEACIPFNLFIHGLQEALL